MNKHRSLISLITLFIVISVCSAQAQIPKTINYQGSFTQTDGTPVNGTVSMAFSRTERSPLSTGGEKEPTLTIDEMPHHHHKMAAAFGSGAHKVEYKGTVGNPNISTDYVGGDQPHNNMPPYFTVQTIIYLREITN